MTDNQIIKDSEVEDIAVINNDDYIIDRYNLYNLILISQKNSTSYQVFHKDKYKNSSKLVFKTPYMRIPFGVESYNNKDIINAEFTKYQTYNPMYNFRAKILQLDSFIKNLSNDEDTAMKLLENNRCNLDLIKGINDKQFTGSVKPRPNSYDPHFRLHLKKSKHGVYTTSFFKIGRNKVVDNINPKDIKGKMAILEIELGTLWTTSTGYGLVWYLNSVQVL